MGWRHYVTRYIYIYIQYITLSSADNRRCIYIYLDHHIYARKENKKMHIHIYIYMYISNYDLPPTISYLPDSGAVCYIELAPPLPESTTNKQTNKLSYICMVYTYDDTLYTRRNQHSQGRGGIYIYIYIYSDFY